MTAKSFLSVFAALFFVLGITANAQTAKETDGFEFLASWRAESFVPTTYRGKVFPTQGSAVSAHIELLYNGTPVDLSGQAVRWLINGKFFLNERGAKHITYRTQTRGGDEDVIRAQLREYQGGSFEHIIIIPIARPEVVVSSPHPYRTLPTGEVAMRAIPYFFTAKTIDALSFSWKINGVRPEGSPERPDLLALINPSTVPDGAPISVFAGIQNKNKETEIGVVTVKFSLKK